LRSFVPIMVAPPAGTDPESNATDHSVPVSSASLGRTRVFQQPGKLRGYRCRPRRGCRRAHLFPSNRRRRWRRLWLPPRYPAGRDQRRCRQRQQKDEPSHPTPLSSSRAYDPTLPGAPPGSGRVMPHPPIELLGEGAFCLGRRGGCSPVGQSRNRNSRKQAYNALYACLENPPDVRAQRPGGGGSRW
jgi:hypothetical protein